MSAVKTPTSSLTASQLLINRLWYRTIAKIEWLFYGSNPETSTKLSSPIAKLPQDIVEVIIARFIYDKRSLLACSLTCYSWYIVAVRHIHYSLTTGHDSLRYNMRETWPRPLQNSYDLGLLPFVRRLRIRLGTFDDTKFTPEWLDRRTLHYLSALTNLQELGIDHLQVFSFMPNIQQYFGYFSPTLRLLALKEPRGSCRQILYFIGLFPNLQDLHLHCLLHNDEQESTVDATLVPLSAPPLRGQLTLTFFAWEGLVKDMITFFGGLWFRSMELFRVTCVRLLLGECAETLETLRLYPTDPYADNHALLQHFDLSRNKSLRTLETTGASINTADDTASGFLGTILSSATSPAPLDLVVIYGDSDFGVMSGHFRCKPNPDCSCHVSAETRKYRTRVIQKQFRVFREVHSVRAFRLVLCADVFDCMVERAMKTLGGVVEAERVEGGLGNLCEPLIISERRSLRTTRLGEFQIGSQREWPSLGCAL